MAARVRLGQALMAVGVVAFGVVIVVFGDLGLLWESKAAARHAALADAGGAILALTGLALLLPPRVSTGAALTLAVFLAVKIVGLCLPSLARDPAVELNWYAPAEALCWAAGALALATRRERRAPRLAAAARYAFGLSLIPIGLSHLVYLSLTASLVPAWLPFRPAWAIATGLCHLGAGVAVLVGLAPRLSAALEGGMMGLFTLLVWIPAVTAKPHDPSNWAELCISTILTAAAWSVTATLTLPRPGGRGPLPLPSGRG